MRLMELLSMHAFLLNNKHHIKVVGKDNAFIMFSKCLILI